MDPDNGASESMNEDSSSDDSDFEEIVVSVEDMALITKLETDLETNPNLYDKHLEVCCLSLARESLQITVFNQFACISL